jgi:hypothetical protein
MEKKLKISKRSPTAHRTDDVTMLIPSPLSPSIASPTVRAQALHSVSNDQKIDDNAHANRTMQLQPQRELQLDAPESQENPMRFSRKSDSY